MSKTVTDFVPELCNCIDCQYSDKPCNCDCTQPDECKGCKESRLAQQDLESDYWRSVGSY